ncbi:MAG TPA: universal stress protein [Solirubrobacterales bacterium]|nr:universal stress protein [Solirubrobacterales bacterium]
MAERHPREEPLRRVHGTGALFSAAYGNVGSSIYYALGVVAAFALGLTPLVFLISGLIFICTAATYAEATVMYPEAGGSSSFARHAFNELVSFFAAWGQVLNYVITVAISAFFVPHYLSVIWEPLERAPADVIGGVILVGGLIAINVIGAKESARLNLVLAIADLATQVVVVAIGIALVFNSDVLVSNVEWGVAPTWGDFALGIAIGMIAYTGIETLSNMSEEARDAARTVPAATRLVVVAVLALYLLIPMVALSAMPVVEEGGQFTTELGTTYAENPMLGIVDNLGLSAGLTEALRVYVGLLAAVILVIATNAGLIGLSRITFSMGQYRQLPRAVRAIHPRFGTPYVSIILFGAVAAIALLPGETELLATMYSFGAMLSFTVAHLAVLRLRRAQPGKRAWKPPLDIRWREATLPLTALLGGLGTFTAWIVVMALNTRTLLIGAGWMLCGVCLYALYRRHQGLRLTETVKVAGLTPLGVEEVEYKSILVAFDEDDPFSNETVATAKALAARHPRRAIHVVSLVAVPANLPLDAPLEERERAAQTKVEQAKLIAGRRVTGHTERVRSGQSGQAIVEEARAIDAAALVMPLRYRNGAPLYGKALQTVLAKRPCRVIVAADPSGQTERVAVPRITEAVPG